MFNLILCMFRNLQNSKLITMLCNDLIISTRPHLFNSLRPRQNGRLFADDTFKRIFLNENIIISTKNSLKFVPKGFINNIPALVLIMAWRRPGDKPLSEPMLVKSLTHICVTRPQWVNKTIVLEVTYLNSVNTAGLGELSSGSNNQGIKVSRLD